MRLYRAAAWVLLALAPSAPVRALEPPTCGPAAEAPSPGIPEVVGRALADEAKRYLGDGTALVTSPLHWQARDWTRFAAFAAALGVLLATDEQTYVAIQERRSATTDAISDATTGFGQPYAWAIAGGLLAGGLITRNPQMRDTGRDAIEAAAFAGLLTAILKPVFGRERPEQSNGETIFHGFTTRYESFPSGHATIAWAVASVVAMRTDGWIVPTVAYTLATLVAFDRVNDEKHFIADVFAGAVIGVAVGRFVVGRHQTQDARTGVEIALTPIPGGIGARLSF
jgi:membrane-associated phospholipid phosphatase